MKAFQRFRKPNAIGMTARLRLEFLVPLGFAILVLLGVWVAVLYAEHRATIARESARAQALMERAYRDGITQHAQLLGAVMETLEQNAPLRAALKARNRSALLRLSAPLYVELQRKHGITHFYFSGPDRINILRVHQPDRYGDRIDRFTTTEAARTGATSFGMELGPLGTFTLRLVTPWQEGDRLLGFVELGVELDQMLRNEEVFSGVPLFPLIAKAQLDRERWEVGMKMLGRRPHWDQFSDAVLSIQAIEPTHESLAASLVERLGGRLPSPQDVVEIRQQRAVYRAAFLPLEDAGGQSVGRIVALVDISPNLAASRSALFAGVANGVIVAALLIGFFHWLVGRLGRQLQLDEAELKRLAVTDSLTGLDNHGQFFILLAQELERGRRFNRPVSLLMIDVDHFKQLNDAHGHLAGDAVLRQLSELVRGQLRSIDSACRYGGEEFTVILPETEPEVATDVAERLRGTVRMFPFHFDDTDPLHITVSIGIASWPAQANDAQSLLAIADAALYQAKRRGRDRTARYDPAFGSQATA
jgi:diguanylate cyclase (GGDEF)-like protein